MIGCVIVVVVVGAILLLMMVLREQAARQSRPRPGRVVTLTAIVCAVYAVGGFVAGSSAIRPVSAAGPCLLAAVIAAVSGFIALESSSWALRLVGGLLLTTTAIAAFVLFVGIGFSSSQTSGVQLRESAKLLALMAPLLVVQLWHFSVASRAIKEGAA